MWFITILLILIALVTVDGQTQCSMPSYRVLVYPAPYQVIINSNSSGTYYSGFVIDVLFAIARVANFTFTLSQENGFSGIAQGGDCFVGGVGALQSGAYDIFAATLVQLSAYANQVDFTSPLYRSTFQLIYNVYTGLSNSKIAIIQGSVVGNFLQNATDPKLQAIWQNIQQNAPGSMAPTYQQAINMVKLGGWAYFGPTPVITQTACDSYGIIALDPTVYFRPFSSFAVQKGSNILNKLNMAILQLQEAGVIDDLLHKWFPCAPSSC